MSLYKPWVIDSEERLPRKDDAIPETGVYWHAVDLVKRSRMTVSLRSIEQHIIIRTPEQGHTCPKGQLVSMIGE